MKKIALISIHPFGDNRINKHIKALLKKGYDIYYFNVSESEIKETPTGITIKQLKINISGSIIKYIKAWKFLLNNIKDVKPDIVHCHDINILPALLLAPNTKRIFDRHEYYELIHKKSWVLFSLVERIFIKRIDASICTIKDEIPYLERIGYRNIACVPNYQEQKLFNCIEQYNKKYKYMMSFIGSLYPDRNIKFILEVMDNLMESNKDICCIIGGKTEYDLVHIVSQKMKKKYQERFIYLDRWVPYDEVISITKASDFCFYPNNPPDLKSPWSTNKLYESLLGGVIYIGVGKNDLQEELIKSKAGIIFNHGVTASEIVDYINELIYENKVDKMRFNAKIMGKKYRWENIESEYIKLYEKLLSTN